VLNRVQIASFLEEWQQLARYVQSDAETFALEEVRSLAEECAAQPHRYLRFFGD
jgi:DNA-binding MurR/RpiR family transcriptional regulator